ncbi:MAG: BON domain-containing protein [Gemmataceae bacterium]|nr:BON domain-containing protein [Gemmataceae bacterium]MDW8244583.1 BON domain-containing protein [Thermogemmata sp.]
MPRYAAVLLLAALYLGLVVTRFDSEDGKRLQAVAGVLRHQIEPCLPSIEQLHHLAGVCWQRWPRRPVDDLHLRLTTDSRLQGLNIAVAEEEGQVHLRGIVPSDEVRRCIIELASHTVGISNVIDELAVVQSASMTIPESSPSSPP